MYPRDWTVTRDKEGATAAEIGKKDMLNSFVTLLLFDRPITLRKNKQKRISV